LNCAPKTEIECTHIAQSTNTYIELYIQHVLHAPPTVMVIYITHKLKLDTILQSVVHRQRR